MTVETRNIYGVSISGNKIAIPPFAATIDKDEALNLSVYLAMAADPGGDDWADALVAIQDTETAERLKASVPKDTSE